MKKIDQLAREAALNSGLVTLDFGNRPVQIELEFAMDLYKAGFIAAREMIISMDPEAYSWLEIPTKDIESLGEEEVS
jgi:hypothetical protein